MTGNETRGLLCPECGGALTEVYAEANYGRVLLLDQCHGCGGVWFDRWELYFVTEAAVRSLEGIDIKALLSGIVEPKGNGLCPKCEKGLKPFTDPNLPEDALMERCPQCSGIWLNRGELPKYRAHKKAFRANPAFEPRAAELATLKHLQKELKVTGIATPTTLELASRLDAEPPIDTKEVAKDLGFLALQSLLRLVFKF